MDGMNVRSRRSSSSTMMPMTVTGMQAASVPGSPTPQ